jgi:hypothetical protein
MPRSVTVVFEDGTSFVYQDVPDNVTPDQAEARALRDFPDRGITEVMGGDIMLREMRDAVASRQATVQDIRAIADRYGRGVPDEAGVQEWIDFAAAHPDFDIPEDIAVPPVSRIGATATGAGWGFENVANTITEFAASLVDRFGFSPSEAVGWAAENLSGYSPEEASTIARNLSGLNSFQEIVAAGREAREARPSVARAREQRPNYFAGGQILGEVAATAPTITAGGAGLVRLGGAAASRAPAAGRVLQQFGRAVQSGGVGVRAPTMANRAAIRAGAAVGGTRLSRLGLRAGGGATAGAAGAALTDQDVSTAAIVGGGIPIIGTIARRGAGAVYDFLRGRLGEVRAAEIMRSLIADNAPAITEALQSAPADARANTAQFLAERGLMTPELAAATRVVSATGENAPLLDVAARRAVGQQEMRNVLAGGETRTQGVAATNAMRQNVRDITDPMRTENLALSDVGRLQIVPAERNARALDATAAEINQSGQVRRMRGLEGRTLEQIGDVFEHPELYAPGAAGRQLPRLGEIADQSGRRADEGIELQLGLRDTARAQRAAADNLRAQGLQPLDITNVVGRLRQQAADAQFVNPPRFRVLSTFADNLEARARSQGGVIDATGLYELRKSMGDTVADLLGPIDPGALQRRTAEIVGETTPLIDDAIEAAGGTGWRQYLNTFSSGMRDVERTEFSRALEALPPQRFERVMAGDDPKFVSDFFGPGRYDVNAELFGSQLPVAQRLGREIGADLDVAATGLRDIPQTSRGPLATGVRRNVEGMLEPGFDILGRGVSRVMGGLPGVHGGGITAERAEQAIANRMARNTLRTLAPALANPANAMRLLPQQSASAQIAGAVDRVPVSNLTLGTQLTQQILAGRPGYAPAPEGEVFLGYGVTAGGQEYPIYGPPPRSTGNR